MSETCLAVPLGRPIPVFQKVALEWVARLQGGRDVVLAIDLTESVGLNDEGRIRMQQIVKDSLQTGDRVYVVPFATIVDPLASTTNPLLPENSIKFNGVQNLDEIMQRIPFQPNLDLQNTDIQRAEWTIYQGLANLNQCRLIENQPIYSQSVVWITDAPLFSKSPATSQDWVETPKDSPFRIKSSPESEQRQNWLQILPLNKRSLSIQTKSNKEYKLTIVDIPPIVQEICTPAPGGRETCLVGPYLSKQLWLPTLLSGVLLIAAVLIGTWFYRRQKRWKLNVNFNTVAKDEDQVYYLRHRQRIAIGEYDPSCIDSIEMPGPDVRAYLVRKGDRVYLEPTRQAPIYYNGQELAETKLISGLRIRLSCPDSRRQDYEMVITIKK